MMDGGLMVPLSDGEHAILARLADVAQHQAVTTERLIAVLERVDNHLGRIDDGREAAVNDLKGHINAKMVALSNTQAAFLGDARFWIALAILLLGGMLGPDAKQAILMLFKR